MNYIQQAPINESQYLPASPDQWAQRLQALLKELRRTDITPIKGYLYAKTADGTTCACIGGIINDMAIRSGLTAQWEETDWLLPSGSYAAGTAWDITRTQEYAGPDQEENLSVPLPEACLHHGFNLEDNLVHITISDMNPEFWSYVNRVHHTALGAEHIISLNDRHIGTTTNPLHLFADIIEHMADRPADLWHPSVNAWLGYRP